MSGLFHLILVQPIFNLLVVLYEHVTFEDLGIAIIVLTLIIRFLLYPLFYKALKNQSLMQKIQPEIVRIQKEHKADRQKQAEEMMKLWKVHKVNPFSSFFILFLQLPILFAVYRVFSAGFSAEAMTSLYSFIAAPEQINNMSLGLINLAEPNMIIVVLAAVAQYFQSALAIRKQTAQTAAKRMVWLGPILTLLILPKLSAALGLYWLTAALFSIVQQHIVNKKIYGGNTTQ